MESSDLETPESELSPVGLIALLDTFQDCYLSEHDQSESSVQQLEKVSKLDDLKRERKKSSEHFLKDVCVSLWKECYLPDDPDAELLSKNAADDAWQHLKKLDKKMYTECKPLLPRIEMRGEFGSSVDCREGDKGRVKACIFYETFWLPRQTPVSSPMELEKCQMKSHKGARYNEKELLLYIDDYYRDSRGVHRVPPVLFHVDSWKVKDETKKKANSPDASGRETETASGTHTRPQSVGLPLEDGKQRNQSEPNGETPSQAEVLTELKLESNGAIGNDCSTNNQEDVDDPRKHTKAKGTMSKTTSGKGKGKGNDEPQQKVNSRDEFVTHISLMSDIDVQNKEVDDLHKLTDNQKVEIMRKRKELKAVDKVASFVETFAEVGKYNMFILTDYIYTSYLQLVERKNKKFITNIPGDHDILVIWKEVGILFFQVKSNLKGHGPKTIVGDITHCSTTIAVR
ncbi:hypothetical protein BSL78_01496 [Apostichopus japonicus]|uniref:Uncharacterized protein n=1 Tax=Stichopus japonicus TaxID=307972 RepID=A0A2G8LMT4_STIJA|nr:hypothetical protein BSL78_01496 [Apostichopus japonicus]